MTTMILIYKGKHGNMYFDVSCDGRLRKAYLALVGFIDRGCGYYHPESLDEEQQEWLSKARLGSWKHAKWLLEARSESDYEYEGIEFEYCVNEREIKEWIGE